MYVLRVRRCEALAAFSGAAGMVKDYTVLATGWRQVLAWVGQHHCLVLF
jgi:hypothetical protein